MSQVLEQVIQEPVTHWGPGDWVEGPESVSGLGTKTVGAKEEAMVLLVAVLIMAESVAVL